MNKEQILQAVRYLASKRALSKDELVDAFDQGMADVGQSGTSQAIKKIGVGEVLYYIGGLIVFFGISILIFQHWAELNVFTRILSTLGSGALAYLLGAVLFKYKSVGSLSQTFFLISALVLPIGLAVLFDNMGLDVGTPLINTIVSAITLAIFWSSYFVFKRTIFALFTIIFATWLFFSITALIVSGAPVWNSDFFEYRTLITGLSYLLLGYSFVQSPIQKLVPWLYAAGTSLFLGAAITLGGYSPNASAFWEVIFVGLVFSLMFLSVYLRSKTILVFSAIFLMIYVLKITTEYFSDSLGWPFALIISGLALIGIGYMAYYLNARFFKK